MYALLEPSYLFNYIFSSNVSWRALRDQMHVRLSYPGSLPTGDDNGEDYFLGVEILSIRALSVCLTQVLFLREMIMEKITF